MSVAAASIVPTTERMVADQAFVKFLHDGYLHDHPSPPAAEGKAHAHKRRLALGTAVVHQLSPAEGEAKLLEAQNALAQEQEAHIKTRQLLGETMQKLTALQGARLNPRSFESKFRQASADLDKTRTQLKQTQNALQEERASKRLRPDADDTSQTESREPNPSQTLLATAAVVALSRLASSRPQNDSTSPS